MTETPKRMTGAERELLEFCRKGTGLRDWFREHRLDAADERERRVREQAQEMKKETPQ